MAKVLTMLEVAVSHNEGVPPVRVTIAVDDAVHYHQSRVDTLVEYVRAFSQIGAMMDSFEATPPTEGVVNGNG